MHCFRSAGVVWLVSCFRNHVGVQQVPFHLKFTGARRRSLCLSGTRFSKRGPGPRSSALRPRREDLCSRCHSSIGTSTAASIPRRVTTCGPFLRTVSSSSLKRAFASCTCHAAKLYLRYYDDDMTSHKTRGASQAGRNRLPFRPPHRHPSGRAGQFLPGCEFRPRRSGGARSGRAARE